MLALLSVEEKASLCLGADLWHTAAIERAGIASVMVADGPNGLRKQAKVDDLLEGVPATCSPTASALASSWDLALARRVGEALGQEAAAEGVGVVLGPGLNIKRSPLCGRNFEYFSEDPLLSGEMAAAMVEGIQSQGVGACLKHYAANNQETERVRVSADVNERALREVYLAGFELAVRRAHPWMVMAAYNKLNGTYCSQDPWLLTEVLRQEWGFDGVVVSDWGAVDDRVEALRAGLDLEMPPNLGVSDAAIVAAVRSGELEEGILDRAVARVLHLVGRARREPGPRAAYDLAAHHELAQEAATSSAVLLRNDGGILPLSPGGTVAVVGELARTPRFQGAGSSHVSATRVDVPVDELRRLAPPGTEVTFAPGYGLGPTSDDPGLAADAARLAAGAAVVVVFLGLPASEESEGFDRRHMDLPANQLAMLAAVAEANPAVVVVLANGGAVRLSSWEHHARAVLETWLSGQGMGRAVAELLWGHVSPSGHLTETIPLRLEDCPSHLNFPGEEGHVRYGEGVFVGYRGYDASHREVSYPFGHGLSYTTFGYRDLGVSVRGSEAGGDLTVSVTVTVANSGPCTGAEVVQVYVHDVAASVARPERELRAFQKVALAPGEAAHVSFELDRRAFSFWSAARRGWMLEAGLFELAVGASSRDIRARTEVDLPAPEWTPRLDGDATIEEWLAVPEGAAALRAAFGTDEQGRPRGLLADEDMLAVIGNFPLKRLSCFPGLGLDPSTVHALTSRLARSS